MSKLKNLMIHCPKEDEFIKVLKYLKKNGFTYRGGSGHDFYWENFGKESTLRIGDVREIGIETISYYKDEVNSEFKTSDYNFITAKQLLNGEIPKEKVKVFIVSWEVKGCGDPQERFVTFVEASKKAKKLAEDENNYNIDIVEIKNRWEVKTSIIVKINKIE